MSGKTADTKPGAKQNAGETKSRVERSGPNEGEGSQTGAREYSEAARAFVKSGKVDAAAKHAERAIDGPDGESLKCAEAEGKRHSHGEDPELTR
jgi:type IV secretory pathway TrbL component